MIQTPHSRSSGRSLYLAARACVGRFTKRQCVHRHRLLEHRICRHCVLVYNMGKKHYRSRGSLELVQEVPLSANGAGVTGNFGQVAEDAQGGRIFVACRGAGELLCAHLHSGRTWSFTGASNQAYEPWGLHYLDLSEKLLVSCLATEAVYVVGPNHRNPTWDEQVSVTMPGFIRRATRCETFYTTSQAGKQSELIVLGVSPLKVLQRVPLPASVGDFAITFDGMLAVVNLVETSEVALISLNPRRGWPTASLFAASGRPMTAAVRFASLPHPVRRPSSLWRRRHRTSHCGISTMRARTPLKQRSATAAQRWLILHPKRRSSSQRTAPPRSVI
jgi:hypothetical protein